MLDGLGSSLTVFSDGPHYLGPRIGRLNVVFWQALEKANLRAQALHFPETRFKISW